MIKMLFQVRREVVDYSANGCKAIDHPFWEKIKLDSYLTLWRKNLHSVTWLSVTHREN